MSENTLGVLLVTGAGAGFIAVMGWVSTRAERRKQKQLEFARRGESATPAAESPEVASMVNPAAGSGIVNIDSGGSLAAAGHNSR